MEDDDNIDNIDRGENQDVENNMEDDDNIDNIADLLDRGVGDLLRGGGGFVVEEGGGVVVEEGGARGSKKGGEGVLLFKRGGFFFVFLLVFLLRGGNLKNIRETAVLS